MTTGQIASSSSARFAAAAWSSAGRLERNEMPDYRSLSLLPPTPPTEV